MKKNIIFLVMTFLLISCQNDEKTTIGISDKKIENISIKQEKQVNTDSGVEGNSEQIVQDNVDIKSVIKLAGEKHLNTNIKAPDLIGLTNWINGDEIQSLDELKGKVVFIDFWTYGCINCIRTLGHMQELHEKYGPEGLVILGLHAPEFSYERKLENLQKEVKKYGLTYLIAQDNDFATWKNYKNRYWPAQYIINKQGVLKYIHYGEGKYDQMDEVVEFLLSE